jgi:hypothetical protein
MSTKAGGTRHSPRIMQCGNTVHFSQEEAASGRGGDANVASAPTQSALTFPAGTPGNSVSSLSQPLDSGQAVTVRKKRNNHPTVTGHQGKKRRGNHLFEITEEEPEEEDDNNSKDEGDEEEFDIDAAFTEQREREEMHQKDISAAEKILMEKHCEEFMRRAFPPPQLLPPGMAPQAMAATIKMCHD